MMESEGGRTLPSLPISPVELNQIEGGPAKAGAMEHRMRKTSIALVSAVAALAAAVSVARADEPELAFMPDSSVVTLLNEGGKYVTVDLKHIDKGQTCRMDKEATLLRMGNGSSPGTVRMRYIGAQLSSGGCPFLTEFDLAGDQYARGRKLFEEKKDAAQAKVEQIKKDIGDKWNEIVGNTK